MNPKPTCRSYTENFNSPVIVEADDWAPQSTSVDMVNISGSRNAYSVKNGILTLRMLPPTFDKNGKQITEGVAATIDMAFKMQYGNVEIRVKANPVAGAVSTFNTMSDSKDEIDIEISPNFFNNRGPTYFESNYFSKERMTGPNGVDHEYYPNIGFNTSADFHVYRIEWYPDHLTWIVDGHVVRTLNKADTQSGSDFNYPMDVSRLEIGIWDAGFQNSGWGGGPINWHQYTELDAQFDYIKVECNPEYNHVIGPRTTTSALAAVKNADSHSKSQVGDKLANGIVIGHHASPGSAKYHH
ncbi:concanavalin A-like lectin/glucanase domain-containing protein [Umbelopsis sp. AD052]|nr:concanavalin A-like lectin/glucanase domain-containing protein [Umbelopsis sp. AD052]